MGIPENKRIINTCMIYMLLHQLNLHKDYIKLPYIFVCMGILLSAEFGCVFLILYFHFYTFMSYFCKPISGSSFCVVSATVTHQIKIYLRKQIRIRIHMSECLLIGKDERESDNAPCGEKIWERVCCRSVRIKSILKNNRCVLINIQFF